MDSAMPEGISALTHFQRFPYLGRIMVSLLPLEKPESHVEQFLPAGFLEAVRGHGPLVEEQVLMPLLRVTRKEEFAPAFHQAQQTFAAVFTGIAVEFLTLFLNRPDDFLRLLEAMAGGLSPEVHWPRPTRREKELLSATLWNLEKGLQAILALAKRVVSGEEFDDPDMQEFSTMFLESLLAVLLIQFRFYAQKKPNWRGLIPALCEKAYLSSRRMGAIALKLGLLKVARHPVPA